MTQPSIEINNLTSVVLDEKLVKKALLLVLKSEKVKDSVDLSIAFVGSGRMRKINKKFRSKNRVTDVLAFPEAELFLEKFSIGPLKKKKSLGEIVICLREVKKNARRLKVSFEEELVACLVHGLLHLLGYDHSPDLKKEEKMLQKQIQYQTSVFG